MVPRIYVFREVQRVAFEEFWDGSHLKGIIIGFGIAGWKSRDKLEIAIEVYPEIVRVRNGPMVECLSVGNVQLEFTVYVVPVSCNGAVTRLWRFPEHGWVSICHPSQATPRKMWIQRKKTKEAFCRPLQGIVNSTIEGFLPHVL